ncbi:MAG: aromatic ring-hydroxylating dioxygenase subunit alpha [Acidobacteriaceae bacterium]|nr:aromatic ring-hydroxylating dioxygenase subunit alpha [Acidobacteriaceae bacterium]MBV9781642.1 aromatic ring-hydroxylating dioxygenase subunit alpha [Acidobacteriaceae bacterium]
MKHLNELIGEYDDKAALEDAFTIPASWYLSPEMLELEQRAVFGRNWQVIGRTEQVRSAGDYITAEVAGEPVVATRGADGILRAFFNVCRHHAAAVAVEECGRAQLFRCPYHGWTYGLDGSLKGVPEFTGVRNFDRAKNGLVPVAVDTWEQFVFVALEPNARSLREFLGGLTDLVSPLDLGKLSFYTRKVYTLNCNWKVFVDNYLDGGYHVPHIHKGLNDVLEYKEYTIENGDRWSLQSSPMVALDAGSSDRDAAVAATRRGDRAYYFWLYPNFMINVYEGVMDTNLVLAMGVDKTKVIFDFFFDDVGPGREARNAESVAVSNKVQEEDAWVCESVQRGLRSRAYGAGRLSVRRESGEHLFHRLLAGELKGSLG